MLEKQLAKKLQTAFERTTYEQCIKFDFNDEQIKELNAEMSKLTIEESELRFYVLKMAVTLALLKGITEGEMPGDCFKKAMKALPVSKKPKKWIN